MIVCFVISVDLLVLIELVCSIGIGLIILLVNEQCLQYCVSWVEKVFCGEVECGDVDYLFVFEDDVGKVVGIFVIVGVVGFCEFWYNYWVGFIVSVLQEFNIYCEIFMLFLVNDLIGNFELCLLFFYVDYCSGFNGKLLLCVCFLFIVEFCYLFGDKLIVEMCGMFDEEGCLLFWESFGWYFFKMEFFQVDYFIGVGNKVFIVELMLKFLFYICFFFEEVCGVIGCVYLNIELVLVMFKVEGFSYQGYVDIFDVGLVIEVEIDKICVIVESQNLVLVVGIFGDDVEFYLIYNCKCEDCCIIVVLVWVVVGILVVDLLIVKCLCLLVGVLVCVVLLLVQKCG